MSGQGDGGREARYASRVTVVVADGQLSCSRAAGLFAAGDVIRPSFPTLAAAVADGVLTASVVSGYLAER